MSQEVHHQIVIVGEHDAHPDMQQLARERNRFHATDAEDEM